MKKIITLVVYGFLIWLIPFLLSFGFYDRSGNLQVSYDVFKSAMIVISSLIGCYMIWRYFKNVENDFVKEGWIIGIVWLFINLLLDVVILVPWAKMTLSGYFASIGLRYLQLPVMCIMAGALLQFRKTSPR